MVWQSGANRIANNLVHHTPYTSIIISGCMTDFFTKNGRELGRTIRRHEIFGLPENPQLEDVRPYLHTRNNTIEYNIVADIIAPPRGYYLALREGPMTGATIKRNIFYASSEPCTFIDELPPGRGKATEDRRGRGLAASKEADTDHNIY